jgi:hypothetical protein
LSHSKPEEPLFLAVIKSKLIGVASNLDSIAIGVEKADGAVAGDFQDLRSANDGNFSPFEYRIKLVDFLVRSDINAEVMQLGYAFTGRVLRPSGQLHQRNIMVLSPEAHKGHLRTPVSCGDLQPEYGAIEILGLLQVSDIKNNVA